MDKNDILQRSRRSLSIKGDERDKEINGEASIWAKSVTVFLIGCLMLFNKYKGLNINTYLLWFIVDIYFGVEIVYKYFKYKNKWYLFGGIGFIIIGIASIVTYIIGV